MREYPKLIKRLIREYAARVYEVELGQALSELEAQFAAWRSRQISAGELTDRIHAFNRGPARELWVATQYTPPRKPDDTTAIVGSIPGMRRPTKYGLLHRKP